MKFKYNSVLADCDVCGVNTEEFRDWLGYERTTLLSEVLQGVEAPITVIDMSTPKNIFNHIASEYQNQDMDVVFKILVEYIILFKKSATVEALAEYLSFYFEDEVAGYNLAIKCSRLFKEIINYIEKFETKEESLIPYHWDDELNRLILIRSDDEG